MNKKYSQKLKRYSAIAGSAVVAGSKLVHAQVIYTDVQPDEVVANTTFEIDLDNDGQMDIGFNQGIKALYDYAILTTPSGSNAQVEKDNSGFMDEPEIFYFGSAIFQTGNWQNVTGPLGGWGTGPGGGNFAGQGDAYLAVRFQISGQYHYGWVLINVATNASTITVKSYAYEQTPNTQILAGGTTPKAEIQNAPSIVNSISAFPITFQFNEDVTGFDVTDVTVGNGTVGNFQTTDGNTYTADITPDGNGDITIDVNSGIAQGPTGSNNIASDQVVVTYDDTKPTLDFQGVPVAVNSTTSFSVTFEFSEDVTGFDINDISVGNGSVSNFQTIDANTYTADITPDGNGDITIGVAGVTDLAGNYITSSIEQITYDNTAPTVTIQSAPASVNNTSPFNVTFQFSEDVTGFDVSDIVVGNGSVGNFQATNGSTYTADITPDGNGDITIDAAGSVAQDGATNDNTAASQVVVTYNATTGVEGGIAASVNVYPNPVANVVTIEGVDVVSVAVLDGNGSQVASSSSNSVDLSELASGNYILRIETNDGEVLKRVIKE